MRFVRPALAATLICVLAAAFAPAAGARVLQGALLNHLSRATATGAAPSSARMQVGVLLDRPHAAAEDALAHDLFDRSSSRYHHFLTPGQFRRRFGVGTATLKATKSWLRRAGLRIDSVSGAGDYVLASGPVSAVQRRFGVVIGAFRFAGESFLANQNAPSVPASLPIKDVLGLNTFDKHMTMARQNSLLGRPAATNVGNITPQELWSVYRQPADKTGRGVSVAILGNGVTDSVIKDLHTFDAKNKLPELPVDVIRTPPNAKYTDDSGNVEWNIDMQAVHGMAPGIDKEVLYFSPTLQDSQLVASTATWVNDPSGPPIMNASLGECEVTPLNDLLNSEALYPLNGNENPNPLPLSFGLTNASEPAQTQLLKQAVMEGRTYFAASGDAGSSCGVLYLQGIGPGNGLLNQVVPLTEDPANNPYATGVGGTVLYTDGNTPAARSLEYAWLFGGGNASPFLTAPDYQHGVSGLNRVCVTDAKGNPSNTGKLCRAVPDVSAISGDVLSNGYTIISDGKPAGGGGTSLSSPLWAGMWARVVGTATKGSGYGFANEAIYRIAKDPARYRQSFDDVTVGTNGLNPALPGYDYATGFGTPRLDGLIANVQAVAPSVKYSKDEPMPVTPCVDKTAPASRFDTNLTGARTIAGRASDHGCTAATPGKVVKVAVSIAQRRPHGCRFMRGDGGLSATRSCSRLSFIDAIGTTTWSLTLPHALEHGRYTIRARATDLAGNVERPNPHNTLKFDVD